MTAATEIQRYQPSFGGRAPAVSQATAIEQQRAISEVQAAVVVAQNCPRDMARAEEEMKYVCGKMSMANHAFYQVTNRGTGPSVHLMRELARIWGNVQFGVNELHRNDDLGESEVQAWAWDVQTNTRSSRTFIVPHQRMRQGARVDLTDLQDIYLNNQNVGARAVRECISTVLPRFFTEEAQNICRRTIEHGEGKPLAERIAGAVKTFDGIGVTERQLEIRLDKKRGQWDAGDVAQLTIAWQSISRGESQQDELFPPIPTDTADEIAAPEKKPAKKAPAKKAQARKVSADREKLNKDMFRLLNEAGLGGDKERPNRLIVLTSLAERDIRINSSSDLSDDEVRTVIQTLEEIGGVDERKAVADNILRAADAAEPPADQQADGDNKEGTLI